MPGATPNQQLAAAGAGAAQASVANTPMATAGQVQAVAPVTAGMVVQEASISQAGAATTTFMSDAELMEMLGLKHLAHHPNIAKAIGVADQYQNQFNDGLKGFRDSVNNLKKNLTAGEEISLYRVPYEFLHAMGCSGTLKVDVLSNGKNVTLKLNRDILAYLCNDTRITTLYADLDFDQVASTVGLLVACLKTNTTLGCIDLSGDLQGNWEWPAGSFKDRHLPLTLLYQAMKESKTIREYRPPFEMSIPDDVRVVLEANGKKMIAVRAGQYPTTVRDMKEQSPSAPLMTAQSRYSFNPPAGAGAVALSVPAAGVAGAVSDDCKISIDNGLKIPHGAKTLLYKSF